MSRHLFIKRFTSPSSSLALSNALLFATKLDKKIRRRQIVQNDLNDLVTFQKQTCMKTQTQTTCELHDRKNLNAHHSGSLFQQGMGSQRSVDRLRNKAFPSRLPPLFTNTIVKVVTRHASCVSITVKFITFQSGRSITWI